MRVIIFYQLASIVSLTLQHKCRSNVKHKINTLVKVNNLEQLLQGLLNIPTKDTVMVAGLKQALHLAKNQRHKLRPREHLSDLSADSDKMLVLNEDVHDVTYEEINKNISSVEKKTDAFFKDVFNFVTMEEEYSIKMILESVRDLEFDVFDLQAKTQENELFVYGMHIMQKEGYMSEFNINHK